MGVFVLGGLILIVVEANTACLQDMVIKGGAGSKRNRVPCEQWPTLEEVRRVIDDNPKVVKQIESVNPRRGMVTVEVGRTARCPGKAYLLIYFPGRSDGHAIRSIIGDQDYFLGVPYEMRNI